MLDKTIVDFGPGEIDAKIISRGKIAEFGRLRDEKYVAALPRLFFFCKVFKAFNVSVP